MLHKIWRGNSLGLLPVPIPYLFKNRPLPTSPSYEAALPWGGDVKPRPLPLLPFFLASEACLATCRPACQPEHPN